MKQHFTNLYCDGCGSVIRSYNTATRSTDVTQQFVSLSDDIHYCVVCASKPLTTFFPLET